MRSRYLVLAALFIQPLSAVAAQGAVLVPKTSFALGSPAKLASIDAAHSLFRGLPVEAAGLLQTQMRSLPGQMKLGGDALAINKDQMIIVVPRSGEGNRMEAAVLPVSGSDGKVLALSEAASRRISEHLDRGEIDAAHDAVRSIFDGAAEGDSRSLMPPELIFLTRDYPMLRPEPLKLWDRALRRAGVGLPDGLREIREYNKVIRRRWWQGPKDEQDERRVQDRWYVMMDKDVPALKRTLGQLHAVVAKSSDKVAVKAIRLIAETVEQATTVEVVTPLYLPGIKALRDIALDESIPENRRNLAVRALSTLARIAPHERDRTVTLPAYDLQALSEIMRQTKGTTADFAAREIIAFMASPLRPYVDLAELLYRHNQVVRRVPSPSPAAQKILDDFAKQAKTADVKRTNEAFRLYGILAGSGHFSLEKALGDALGF